MEKLFPVLAVSISPLLANAVQSAEGSIVGALVQGGTTGVVLAWFMWRNERRMAKLENAWNNYSRVRLLSICANHAVPASVKDEAESLMAEVAKGTKTPFKGE